MIEIAQPWALVSLASIPIVVVLHLLRPRRRQIAVSSTRLWEQALRESRQGLGLQRLLRDLSLLLLILIALATSLALSDPEWITDTHDSADTVLIVDVSASMKARAALSTRFERARIVANETVDALPRDARMLVMTSGRRAVLRSAFLADKDALRQVLGRIEPTDEAGRPREAVELALTLLRDRERGRVVFVTDAAFDDEPRELSPRVEYRVVGSPARNVAITRFDVRREIGSEERLQVLLAVRNYTSETLEVPVQVLLERRAVVETRMALLPDTERSVVLPVRGRATGRAEARIDVDDALAADNRAFAVMPVDEGVRVLLVGPGNFYLERLLEAMPGVHLSRADRLEPSDVEREARIHDVVVFDRVDAPRLPPGSYVLLDTVAPGLPFAAVGRTSDAAIVGRGASALIEDVDLSAVRIDEAIRIELETDRSEVQRLFWSRETVLALALLEDDVRLVYLGFDLARSNLPLQLAFPLLVSKSFAWLDPRRERESSTQIPAGELLTIAVPGGYSEITVRLPSGEGRIHSVRDGRLLLDSTSEAGIYRYSSGDVARYFAVNATDAAESDLAARPVATGSPSAPGDDVSGAQVAIPLWPYLTGIALALLLCEWAAWRGARSHA